MGCLVIRTRHDVCARTFEGGDGKAVARAARSLAEDVACEPDEWIRVGLSPTRDPGAARLMHAQPYADGGVEWLYEEQVQKL